MSTRTRPLLIAATCAALALASACGGDDGTEPVASASSVPPSVEVAGPVDRADFFRGVLDRIDDYDNVHLSVDTNMGGGEVDIDYSGAQPVIHVDANSVMRGPSQFVIADGTVYVEQTQGGKWSVIDENDPSYGDSLKTYRNIGPIESVRGLQMGVRQVRSTGTRTVEGEELSVYELAVDPTEARGAFKALAGNSGMSELTTFTLYVDATGLLRRVETDVGGDATTVALSAWGEPVVISVPTGSQLVTY